jgi:hypothetical protein
MEAEYSEKTSVADYMAINVRKTTIFTVTAKRTPSSHKKLYRNFE